MTEIQIEDVSSVKKKVTFEIPPERVASVLDEEYRLLKKTIQVKGFRKGKAPLDILRAYFKTKVQADAAKKIIEETFEPGLGEKKISLVSVISLDQQEMKEGEPFRYTAEIEVPPPIEIHGYKGLKLNKVLREVTDEQVTERLDGLRKRFASLKPIPDSRTIQDGDYVNVDIGAQENGEGILAFCVEDYHMEVGRNFYLPDFDANLHGMKPYETRTITLQLPEDFTRKDLAGKTVEFEITVNEAKERVLPDVDDDFAKDIGGFQSLDDLKAEIRKDLTRAAERRMKREMKEQIVDQLIGLTSFEVPESMVEREMDRMLFQSLESLISQGIDPKRFPSPTKEQREQLRPSAERSVRAGLILNEISKQEALEVSEADLQAGIESRASEVEISPDAFREGLESEDRMDDLRSILLEEKVYKLIEDNGEVTLGTAPDQKSEED